MVLGTFPRVLVGMHLRQLSVYPRERMMICASISTLLYQVGRTLGYCIWSPLVSRECQSGWSLRTESHTILCRGVWHGICGGYGG